VECNPLANANLCEVFGDGFGTGTSQRFQHPCALQFALLSKTADIYKATTSLCSRGHLLQVLLHGGGKGGLAAGKEQISLDLGSLDTSFVTDCCPLEGVSLGDVAAGWAAAGDADVVCELDRHLDFAACIRHGN